MAFQDTLVFPRDVAGGLIGGPERRVDIVPLSNGAEERNARWADSRRAYDAGLGIRAADQLAAVVDLFEEVGGPLHSFRFRDWSDYKSSRPSQAATDLDQTIGTGDGTTPAFQLVKTYGSVLPYTRTITKPVGASVVVALDGVSQASGWTVDQTTGVVTFSSAPAIGVVVTAGFEFDIPVRFNAQKLDLDMAFFTEDLSDVDFGSIPQIPLIEVRE